MSHVTYHYLLNGSKLSGHYIYDSMHIPNKSLQDKVLKGYLKDRLAKLKLIAEDPSNPKAEFARQELDEISKQKTVKDKVNVHFRNGYNRMGMPELLGRPYFGVWGIHTTPADLFGVDPRYKYRLKIDCDTVDPDVIIIKVSTGKYSSITRSMGKDYFKYTPSIFDKFCKPFQTKNSDIDSLVSDAYNRGPIRTVSSSVPDIIFFLPRLKFLPSDFEVFEEPKDMYYRVVDMKTHLGIYEAIKKEVPLGMWKHLLSNDAISWLPKPPNTGNEYKGCISYFTKDGLEIFNEKTLPIFKKILGNARIKIEPIKSLPGKIVYKDQYQVVVRHEI